MIKEAYVSYEIAKLLKERGFEEPTTHWYNIKKSLIDDYPVTYKNFGNSENVWLAPTHQMACAWLRERNIGIVPEIHTTQDPKDYHWGACIFHLDKSWDVLQYVSEPSKNVIDGYDGVIEHALKYVLENLI